MAAFVPAEIDPTDVYKLMTGLVVPRPIGWIGTADAEDAFAEPDAADDRRGHEVPAKRVGPDGVEHVFGIGIVLESFRELVAVLG